MIRKVARGGSSGGGSFFRHSPVLPLLAALTAGLALLQSSILAPFVLFALRDLHLSRASEYLFYLAEVLFYTLIVVMLFRAWRQGRSEAGVMLLAKKGEFRGGGP